MRERTRGQAKRPQKDEQQQLHSFTAPKRQQRQPPHDDVHRLLEKVGVNPRDVLQRLDYRRSLELGGWRERH